MLYGRGAADMKGSLAAMITATERFLNSGKEYPGTIAFLLTSDEEDQAVDGTAKAIKTIMVFIILMKQLKNYHINIWNIWRYMVVEMRKE